MNTVKKILALESNKYAIKVQNFEGPLDLLCALIEKNKMSIYDIKLDEITNQYIRYINEMEKNNIEVMSEFVVMASTLLYLKSRKLLPQKQEIEEEITEEELIKRIIEYKKYKDIKENLKENFEMYSGRIFKLPENISLPKQKIDDIYDKEIIYNAYFNLLERNKKKINENAKNIEKIAITEHFTVSSKLKEMFKELIKNKKFVFNNMFSIKEHSKNEVITAFSGLLELSRRNKVDTYQDELFGDIKVKKRKKDKS